MGNRSSISKSKEFHVEYPVNNGKSLYTTYINLDHRTDRRQEIESELNRMQVVPYTRFSAIKHEKGMLGCTMSHIGALKKGLESGADHILIFEDDFQFTIEEPVLLHHILNSVMETNYDVFMLGYCFFFDRKEDSCIFKTDHGMFKKITKAACAHGYMVKKEYVPKLLQNFETSLRLRPKAKPGKESEFNNDDYWQRLQETDNWLCYNEPCGIQRSGLSDICKIVKWNKKSDISKSLGK